MTQKLTVKDLKECLDLAMSIHMAYDKSKADGKLDWDDLQYAYKPAMKLIPAIKGAGSIPAQIKDMDTTELEELKAWAKIEYDLRDDEVEAKIEKGLALVLHIAQFVGAVV